MHQIVEHFSPALVALLIGVLLMGIFVGILQTNGPIAQAFENCITSSLTTLQNALPTL